LAGSSAGKSGLAAAEVRAPQFGIAEGDLDPEMVAIAGAIIRQRTSNFDPNTHPDRYQEALPGSIPTLPLMGLSAAPDSGAAFRAPRSNRCRRRCD
jgi:hypothetical protein